VNPNKPPEGDPIKRLVDAASARMMQLLKDWVATQKGQQKSGRGGPGSAAARNSASSESPLKHSPGMGNSTEQPLPATVPAPISSRDAVDAVRATADVGKWIFRILFFVVPAIGIGKYFWSGRAAKRGTDFNESNTVIGGINRFFGELTMGELFGSIVPVAIFIVGIIFVVKSIRVVPQQRALVVERLGRFDRVLEPGLRFTIPFIDRISAKHDLREVPLDVPPQVCITKDNTQLQVDGILYFQITDPRLATYGSSNPILAITQLAQTTLRSVIGKLELDKTFEERDTINHAVVNSLDAAAMNWGVKVLRYEIKDLTPPKEILHAMQSQITAEREKRALIAASEGRKQEQINIAVGQKEASIAKSEGNKIADINQAQGEAAAILAKAEANAEAIRKIASAIESQGGLQAVNLKVAEQYVAAFGEIAKAGNTIVVPQNLSDIAGLVTAATSVLKVAQK
jgi:regulator of protease activity HflC (stomatin/prohibitin superfamily)